MSIPVENVNRRSRPEISRGFDRLIEEGKIYGAELNSSVIKKSGGGGGARFLVATRPSRKKLLSRWEELFRNQLAPDEFLAAVSGKIQEYEHGENLLLFGAGRVIYDTKIFHLGAPVGGMTLFFYSERDQRFGWKGYIGGRRLRIVYIEQIQLRQRSSGYASALFQRYEDLFRELGFNQFRLKASLSVGKYYWAKEVFDCSSKADILWKK